MDEMEEEEEELERMPIIEEATCMKIGFKEEDGARE